MVPKAEPKGKGSKGKKRGAESTASDKGLSAALLNDFGVEYAKSGRATCAACFIKISKDEIRIKKTAYDTEVGMKFGGQAIWHHVECFAQLRTELGWLESAEFLPGLKVLNKDDQEVVKQHIPYVIVYFSVACFHFATRNCTVTVFLFLN